MHTCSVQDRLRYEVESLRAMHVACPAHTPEVYAFDPALCVIAMQYIAPPAVVLRYGILDGAVYPHMPAQAAEFMATTLFRSSQFALGTSEFTAHADKYSNREMCALTEQVRIVS
jgi:5-methylthioribose kinase